MYFSEGSEQNCFVPRCPARSNSFCPLLLATLLLFGGYFQAPGRPANYFTRIWQVENGLPQNKVTAVVQTHDGYLWVGTYSGLARFDGVRFTVVDENNTPAMPSSRVTSLFEAVDGTLWIGDESGQVAQYKDGTFQAVAVHAKWDGGKIHGIAADESGDVWLLNEFGQLARVRDGLVLNPESGPVAKMMDLTHSVGGTIWIARAGRISKLERAEVHSTDLHQPATNDYVQGIAASTGGGLWVASNGLIRKWKDDQWVENLGAAPWSNAPLTRLMETSSGALAAGTSSHGLYLVFPDNPAGSLHFDRANGFPSDWVISLCEDRERNLWAGIGGGGLVLLRPSNIQTISPPDQWQGRAVLSVCAGQQGALWIGTEGAGLYRFQNHNWTNFGSANLTQGIRNPYIWSLAEDERGRLSAGTWGGGLFLQNGNDFDFAPGMENITPPMPALYPTHNGDLWIGTEEGLLRYRHGDTTWFLGTNGQSLRSVRTITEDNHQAAIWFGTAGNGLACLANNQIHQFRKADGLSSDFIECLHFDTAGALWIGTFGGGLNRLKNGHFSVINGRQGLPNSVIGDIEEDGLGYFWMSSHDGIIRVSEAELNRCADEETDKVNCLTYGVNDGLPTIECSEGLQPAGCRTADGRLWFPTAKGLVSVDPANVTVNHLPPPVIIEEFQVDDKPFNQKQAGATPLKIPPGRHRLEFQYTGLSFVAPEKVRFKYRLKGFDDDWVEAETKRVATYNYIPPGNYTFQVAACNSDGIWNESGASVAFDVLPYFWQTAWFRLTALAVLVMASGSLVWFDTRRRMRRKLERAERQRDIERERTRIARDIHDDLGAYLTRITMISESTRGDLKNPDRAEQGLNKIYETARELTRSMDEIVWAVNPRHDTLEGLASYLEKFAQDWLATAGLRCRLDLPVQFPEWGLTSEVRHNLFLACKEALHNIVKHSGASEVYIRLTINPQSFDLSIEDNGCGFPLETKSPPRAAAAASSSSGNGLENMARRLAGIGGTCEIHSQPGGGTKINFRVHLKALVA